MKESLNSHECLSSNSYLIGFDQIGSGEISLFGGKGENLALMYQEGFPIPPGVCITTKLHDLISSGGQVPEFLIKQLETVKDSLGGRVAIRSSAICEDDDELSMAGVFKTEYLYENDNIGEAIERIYAQSGSTEVVNHLSLHQIDKSDARMALVIQELIEPDFSGVVYTGINGNKMLVQYDEGFGVDIVDGATHGSSFIYDTEKGIINQSCGFEQRPLSSDLVDSLIRNSQEIGRYFGGNQDIEFAIKEKDLFILQARPLTTELGKVDLKEIPEETLEATKENFRRLAEKEKRELKTETVIFSDANFGELLPSPTEMDYGIFAYIFTGSDDIAGAIQLGRLEMGYPLGEESIGFMYYIGGKPFFSIARDAATFYSGFPETKEEYFETLVSEYLQKIGENPTKGEYPEMGLYLQDPTIEDLRARFGEKAEEYYQTYLGFKEQMGRQADQFIKDFYETELLGIERFIEKMAKVDLNKLQSRELVDYCESILEHLRTTSCVDFVKAARLGFYYSQKLQLDLKAKLGIEDEKAESLFAKLSQGLDGSMITEVNLAIVGASSEQEAIGIARNKVGHYSTGEMLEVRHKRLKEKPDALREYVRGLRESGGYAASFQKQKTERLTHQTETLEGISDENLKQEVEKDIKAAQTYMALRETIKYQFVREYSLIRDALEVLGNKLDLSPNDVYFVYPRELNDLVSFSEHARHLISSRRQAYSNYSCLDLPTVVREKDIDNLGLVEDVKLTASKFNGKFLADGAPLEGVVVNVDEFVDDPEQLIQIIKRLKEGKEPIILVARQMNLSHDPLINIASGLVIEKAGIVSHGAQRARELGKGAIGGIKSKYLKTGVRILFDPTNKLVKKIKI